MIIKMTIKQYADARKIGKRYVQNACNNGIVKNLPAVKKITLKTDAYQRNYYLLTVDENALNSFIGKQSA